MCGSHLGGKNVHSVDILHRFSNLSSRFASGTTHYMPVSVPPSKNIDPHCKTQPYTVPKLGNCDFQSFNNRNTDLNIARHLHQVHLKCQQEHSITGRRYRTAKISACVNVLITIRLFWHLVWTCLSLNIVFGFKWQYICIFIMCFSIHQKRELLSSSLFYSFVWV